MARPTTIELTPPVERAFLVAVDTGDDGGWTAQESLVELANLATTAGAEVVGAEWQNRRHVDPNWYIGKGKAEELVAAKSETGFDLLVADDELSPAQQKALESLLNVKVIDRSRLILDIFAQHAQTHEGRLQVELAQLEYQLPRLTRLWTHLSRTGGGIGTRGPGESQLETDRRLIRERIKKMKERVDQVRQHRATAARGRDRRLTPTVGIVGYTNAGKSTLLNALVGSEVARAEDKLFATLDPTSRQVRLGEGQTAIVTDTVGFIHKLPAPARRRVPGDPRGGQPGRRARRGRRRVRSAPRRAPGHRPARPRRARRRRQAAAHRLQQGRPRRAGGARRGRARARRRGLRLDQRGDRLRARRAAGRALDPARLAVGRRSTWPCRTPPGELLARVRERGTVEVEYGERDVRVRGRMAPVLAGELDGGRRALGRDAARDGRRRRRGRRGGRRRRRRRAAGR